MNYIVVIYDTLRRDYVGCNGMRPIHTPNWDRFAEGAWNFSRCYTGSYPSLPHRCDCATGRFVFPFYGWQDLPEGEVNLCAKLTQAGYRTHTLSDGGMWAHNGPGRGFQTNDVVKTGHEPTAEEIAATPLPCRPEKSRNPEALRKMWALRSNLLAAGDESAWAQARVMTAASEWVAEQARSAQPFFLWIESWRIHETWIDPPQYVDLYDPGYQGEKVALPSYSPTIDYLSPDELNHIRAMYAASVTFSDKWFGVFLDTLERSGLLENTLVLLSADHGYSLGDHGRTGKHTVPNPPQEPWPLYEECAHVPLLVHCPGQRQARRCNELAQHADILPTLLDWAGIDPGPTAKGVSWRPLLEGKPLHTRDVAVTCSSLHVYPNTGNNRVTITSKDYSLILPTPTQGPELYNLALDPGQTLNLFPRHRAIASDLHAEFLSLIRRLGVDEEKARSWEGVLDRRAW